MSPISYKSLLKHRCQILRLTQTQVDGSPEMAWKPLLADTGDPLKLRCFLDLNFIRRGKDPIWTAEAGRPQDRTGVWFGMGNAPLRSGDRIKMVKGPEGTFQIQGAIDEAWSPHEKHHLEIGVVEVAAQLARAAYGQPPHGSASIPDVPSGDALTEDESGLLLTSDTITDQGDALLWETDLPITDQGQSWSVETL